MKNLEVVCIDGKRMSIKPDSIIAYKENDSEVMHTDDGKVKIPACTVIWFGGGTVRVRTTYDELEEKIKLSEMGL